MSHLSARHHRLPGAYLCEYWGCEFCELWTVDGRRVRICLRCGRITEEGGDV